MPTTIVDSTVSGISLATVNDHVIVTRSGVITGGIGGLAGSHDISIDGEVYSTGIGISITGSAGDNRISIGTTGLVSSLFNDAIRLVGDDNTLINNGELRATKGNAVEMFGSGNVFSNSGIVSSGEDIIEKQAGLRVGDSATLSNSGTITSFGNIAEVGTGSQFTNTGTMIGQSGGIFSFGSLTFQNTGQLTSANGFGVSADGGLIFQNSGSINVQGIVIDQNGSLAVSEIRNSGDIQSDDLLLDSESGFAVYVQNSGQIETEGGIDSGSSVIVDNSGQMSFRNGAGINCSSVFFYNASEASFTNNVSDLIIVTIGGEIKNAGTVTSYAKVIDYNPVTGPGAGLLVENSGTMNGASVINAFGSDVKVTNSGTMTATGVGIAQGYVIGLFATEDGRIINTGEMVAIQSQAIYAVNSTGSHVVKNFGTIMTHEATEGTQAILINNGVSVTGVGHSVINGGTIVGDVELSQGDDLYQAGLDGVVFGTIELGSGNDTAIGGNAEDVILGGDGDDTIRGRDGHDDLQGGLGADEIRGQDGDDTIDGGDGLNIIFGGRGDDLIIGGADRDEINGGADDDRIEGNGGDDLLKGDKGEDTIIGGLGNDTVRGGFGDDDLFGNAGDDFLTGDQGDDLLTGARGNDRIDGGTGIDTAVYAGDIADYTFLLLNNGDIRVIDNVGNDGTDRVSTVEFFEFSDVTVAAADLPF